LVIPGVLPEKGEEPPEEVKRLLNLLSLSKKVSPATPESKKVWDEIYSLLRENYWFSLISQKTKNPAIVSANSNFADIHTARVMEPEYALEQMFFRQ